MSLKTQAELAAQRVNEDNVSFDPLTIITIITQVLPLIAQCWNRNDSPDPAESKARLAKYHEQHPEACLKRTARRIRAEADQRMTKAESIELAKAVIEQALSADEETVAACCAEAG